MTRSGGVLRRAAAAGVLLMGGASLVLYVTALAPPTSWRVNSVLRSSRAGVSHHVSSLFLLRSNVKIPLLDLLVDGMTSTTTHDDNDDNNAAVIVTPLPSSHLPPELATPFLYGMQVDRPVHKRLLEEAMALAATSTTTTTTTTSSRTPQFMDSGGTIQHTPAMYGHLVWKPQGSSSLVGAIGCTAQILVNAPTTEVLSSQIAQELGDPTATTTSTATTPSVSASEPSPTRTVLCRGGFRFVVKEVLQSIPFPIALVDEIQDDDEWDDSDMFASVVSGSVSHDDDDDEDDEDPTTSMSYYSSLSGAELLQRTMRGIQSILSQKLREVSDRRLSPLEQQILQSSGITIDPHAMELARVEEMVAVFDVFQEALVDDISPNDRKFAVAIMAAELADMNNHVRQQVVVTRDAHERLRIVVKELDEIRGMATARKVAKQITQTLDDDERDLKVGTPHLPPWAKTIVKGTKVEYFWNEEYGWCTAEIIADPVTVVDEILLTVRFEDGEVHKLPLSADDKVRWRPRQ
jgi:hypothetical protein